MEPLREPEDPLTPPFNPEPESLSILITGGTGCVGIAIAKAILVRHPTALIHVLDLNVPAKDSTDTDWRAVPGVAGYFPVDITDEVGLRNAFDRVRPRVVIHAASLIPSAAKKLSFGDEGVLKVNVEGTRIVLQVAKQVGTVEALVYTGSSDAVKRDSWENFENYTEEQEEKRREASTEPEKWDEVYAKSKALAERLVLSDDLPFKTCTIRTHAVVGRYDRNLVPQLANLPRKINIGRGQNLYDFTGVDNLALAHVLAVENLLDIPPPLDLSGLPTSNWTKSANRKAFFVTNADPRPFRSVLELIWTELDRQERIQKEDSQLLQSAASRIGRTTTFQSNFTAIPVNVVYFFVWLASGISRTLGAGPPWLTVEELGDAVSHRYFSNELAKDILGYHPVKSLEESIRDACESYIDSLNKKGKVD